MLCQPGDKSDVPFNDCRIEAGNDFCRHNFRMIHNRNLLMIRIQPIRFLPICNDENMVNPRRILLDRAQGVPELLIIKKSLIRKTFLCIGIFRLIHVSRFSFSKSRFLSVAPEIHQIHRIIHFPHHLPPYTRFLRLPPLLFLRRLLQCMMLRFLFPPLPADREPGRLPLP